LLVTKKSQFFSGAAALCAALSFSPGAAGEGYNDASRLTITPRLGLALPGSVTPDKRFELGAYLHYSGRPITERGTAPTDGLWTHLVSVGPAAKVPFALAPGSRIRAGAMLGYNRVWQGFENGTFEGTITGQGLNFSASIEYSRDLAPGSAFNVQLGFLSQIAGSADLGPIGAFVEGGSEQDLAFPPLVMLTTGIDLCR
jgi:hypothetical protein